MTNPALDVWTHVFGYEPKGFLALKKFCRAVDAGESPDPEFLQTCRRAFKRILDQEKLQDGLMFFADEMDLNKTHTNKRTGADADAELELVMAVLILEREGFKPSKAKKEIAETRRKSLRTIQRYYKEHESDARGIFKNFKI